MRSWRRGTREMDLILGPFSDQHLAEMTGPELEIYDHLLDQNDQDLYQWVTGQRPGPELLTGLLNRISVFAKTR